MTKTGCLSHMHAFHTFILMTNTKNAHICSKPTTWQVQLGAKYTFVSIALKIAMDFIYKNSFTSCKIHFCSLNSQRHKCVFCMWFSLVGKLQTDIYYLLIE